MSTTGNKMVFPSRPAMRHHHGPTVRATPISAGLEGSTFEDERKTRSYTPRKRESAPPEDYRWQTFEACREHDMVNCSFGEEGPCLNPKHQPKWLREKMAASNGARPPMEKELSDASLR